MKKTAAQKAAAAGGNDMLCTIRNEALRAQIDTLGAQLMCLTGKTEYLWQGDAKYWKDRSITIFPYVARLTDGKYTYRGKMYHLPIHGFAPEAEFAVTDRTENAVTLCIGKTPEFFAQFPFDFRYAITYRLESNTLRVEISVQNRGDDTMHFALGGHPGINVPLEDGLSFEDYVLDFGKDELSRVEFSPDCFVTGELTAFSLPEGKLPLRHDLFDDDAIVLKNVPASVTLRSEKGARGVTLTAPDFPVFGFWHMPKTDAPYVCLEPWSSLPSRKGVVEDLQTQPDLIALPAGETYRTAWSLTCF